MSTTKHLKVLIIEDQENMREVVAEDFASVGWQSVEAEHGRDALEKLKLNQFDLIVSDIRMPVMDGAQFLDEFRKIYRDHPPLIFMTGYTDIKTYELLDRGACAVLAKPLEIDQLMSWVKLLTTKKEQRWSQLPDAIAKDQLVVGAKVDNALLDIGLEGFFVASEALGPTQPLAANDIVAFEIPFPGTTAVTKLTGTGKVIWNRKTQYENLYSGFGVQFLHIDDPGRTELIKAMSAFNRPATIPKGSKKV